MLLMDGESCIRFTESQARAWSQLAGLEDRHLIIFPQACILKGPGQKNPNKSSRQTLRLSSDCPPQRSVGINLSLPRLMSGSLHLSGFHFLSIYSTSCPGGPPKACQLALSLHWWPAFLCRSSTYYDSPVREHRCPFSSYWKEPRLAPDSQGC
jgi:hypothetical protein